MNLVSKWKHALVCVTTSVSRAHSTTIHKQLYIPYICSVFHLDVLFCYATIDSIAQPPHPQYPSNLRLKSSHLNQHGPRRRIRSSILPLRRWLPLFGQPILRYGPIRRLELVYLFNRLQCPLKPDAHIQIYHRMLASTLRKDGYRRRGRYIQTSQSQIVTRGNTGISVGVRKAFQLFIVERWTGASCWVGEMLSKSRYIQMALGQSIQGQES